MFGYEPKGQGFESLAARHDTANILVCRIFFAFCYIKTESEQLKLYKCFNGRRFLLKKRAFKIAIKKSYMKYTEEAAYFCSNVGKLKFVPFFYVDGHIFL